MPSQLRSLSFVLRLLLVISMLLSTAPLVSSSASAPNAVPVALDVRSITFGSPLLSSLLTTFSSPVRPPRMTTFTSPLASQATTGAMWKFVYNPPSVSLFSGAATYDYSSIQVPPGRNGLQPKLNLSYNSRRVDGLLTYTGLDTGPLGVGWSVDQMDVIRVGFHPCEQQQYTCFDDNKFVLVLNGTGYDLIPASYKFGLWTTTDYSASYAGSNSSDLHFNI